jgi:hypothetical protein
MVEDEGCGAECSVKQYWVMHKRRNSYRARSGSIAKPFYTLKYRCLAFICEPIFALQIHRHAKGGNRVDHLHRNSGPHPGKISLSKSAWRRNACHEWLTGASLLWKMVLPVTPPAAPMEIIAAATTARFCTFAVWLFPYANDAGTFAWVPHMARKIPKYRTPGRLPYTTISNPTIPMTDCASIIGHRIRSLSDSQDPASEAMTANTYGGEDSNCAFAYAKPMPSRRMMGWKKTSE